MYISRSDQYIQNILLKRGLLRYSSTLTLAELSDVIGKSLGPDFPRIISIVGGAASGKSTLTRSLTDALKNLGMSSIVVINTDDYSVGTRSFREEKLRGLDPYITHNFNLLRANVERLCSLGPDDQLIIPKYDPGTGAGVPPSTVDAVEESKSFLTQLITGPIQLTIVEGDFQPLVHTDYILYLHLSDRARLENRIRRDIEFRNYPTKGSVIESFVQRQRSQHNPYTLPAADTANAIVWSKLTKHLDQTMYAYDLYTEKNIR
jgi:uridine kinase